jgi:O-antigen/teichoic acid export membrane protein
VVAGECVAFFTVVAVMGFAAMKRNVMYAVAAFCGLLANAGMNLLLIPAYSFEGAAWATLATELLVTGILWTRLSAVLRSGPFPLGLVVKGAAAGLVAAVLALAVDLLVPWIAAALIAVAVYLALLHFGRVPGPDGLVGFVRDDELLPLQVSERR